MEWLLYVILAVIFIFVASLAIFPIRRERAFENFFRFKPDPDGPPTGSTGYSENNHPRGRRLVIFFPLGNNRRGSG